MRLDTRTTNAHTESCRIATTLDAFAAAISRADGVSLRDLAKLDCLDVRTCNSWYRIVVLDPLHSRVLVSGGAFLPTPVEGIVSGASIGGSMLKLGCILHGFQLEILHAGTRIVTTSVRQIHINAPDAVPGPF